MSTADDHNDSVSIAEPEDNVIYKQLEKTLNLSHTDRDPKMRVMYETFKKELRSVCISAGHNFLSFSELEEDYRNLNGVELIEITSALGFSSVEDILNHLDGDVVSIFTDATGVPRLKTVSSANTRHLEELVSKQKRSRVREKIRATPYSRSNRNPVDTHFTETATQDCTKQQ